LWQVTDQAHPVAGAAAYVLQHLRYHFVQVLGLDFRFGAYLAETLGNAL
jgi:hypothetical protein